MLTELGITVRQNDLVLDLWSGQTKALAAHAAHVIVLDTDRDALQRAREINNVTPVLGDGETLHGVGDASVDGAVADLRDLRNATETLRYVGELGRVLKPGAWAAFALSTRRTTRPKGHSRRELFQVLTRPPEPRSPFIPLEALGAVAEASGLTIEQIEGSGTERTFVRATGSRAS